MSKYYDLNVPDSKIKCCKSPICIDFNVKKPLQKVNSLHSPEKKIVRPTVDVLTTEKIDDPYLKNNDAHSLVNLI